MGLILAKVRTVQVISGNLTHNSLKGDSGGPLLTANQFQVGVVSFGQGCARPDTPAVYARVSAYEEWIAEGICRVSANPPSSCKTDIPTTSPSFKTTLPDVTAAPSVATANDATASPTVSPTTAATTAPSASKETPAPVILPTITTSTPSKFTPKTDSPTLQVPSPVQIPAVTIPGPPFAWSTPSPVKADATPPSTVGSPPVIVTPQPIAHQPQLQPSPIGAADLLPNYLESSFRNRQPTPVLNRMRTSPPASAPLPTIIQNSPILSNFFRPNSSSSSNSLFRPNNERNANNSSRKNSMKKKKKSKKKKKRKKKSEKR